MRFLTKIISGGQTGVDRAALDAALQWELPIGGWCPRGRRAEDGPVPEKYPQQQTETANYAQRTKRNVKEADGTLILIAGEADGGTKLTAKLAKKYRRPYKVVDLNLDDEPRAIRKWLMVNELQILNVAGPRESSSPGIYALAFNFLVELLR